MTARGRTGRLSAAFVWAQMRADAAALAVALVVVAIATLLTAAIPPAVDGVVSAQVRESVDRAGDDAAVVITVPLAGSEGEGFAVDLSTADSAAYVRGKLDQGMPAELSSVLGPPTTTLLGRELKAGTFAGQPARVRFAYVTSDSGPAVEWVEGREPGATGDPLDVFDNGGEVLPVEVGLSEQAAQLTGLGAGDKIPVISPMEALLDVTVSGVYRALDPSDPSWATVPTLLAPQTGIGAEGTTVISLYSSAESIPFARLANFPDSLSRFYTYPVVADAITAANMRAVQAEAKGLATGKEVFEIPSARATVQTRLDLEIGRALVATTAATAQASVMLVALISIAALVELVAAGLLVGRRQRALEQARSRGATGGIVAAALAVESALVVLVGGALGVFAARALVDGDLEWRWIVPPLLLAFAAAPCLAARAATRRAVASGASAVRRLVMELALIALAAFATASLVARGVSASEGAVWQDLVVLAAPVLCALAVAVVLVRVQAPLTRWARAAASRTNGASSLLAAARSRLAPLAVCSLLLAASVISMAATTSATVSKGLGNAADVQVGTDVVARAAINQVLPGAVDAIDGEDGVSAALAYVVTNAQLLGSRLDRPVTIVAVDAEQFDEMAAAGGNLPRVDALIGEGGDAVPVLVSAGSADLSGASLHWEQLTVPVKRVGPGVAIPGVTADQLTVVVDRSALEDALGVPVPATFLWANGENAETAVRAAIGDAPATVTTRTEWLHDQVSSPVARGLRALFLVASGFGLALALLTAVLIAASGTRDRRRAMGRLRVLGLPRASAWRVAQAELTIPAVIASAVGVLVGCVLAVVVRDALHLTSITGQARTPDAVVPWWLAAVPLVIGAAAWLGVWLSARAEKNANLGQVLRGD